jgi:Tat protein translocase TatB subunit
MLNVGPLELLVVLAIALIVVGPERLPELARSVGRMLRQLRQVQDEVRDMVASGVDDDVRQAASDFRKATSDLTKATDVKGASRRAGRAARTEARETLRPAPRTTTSNAADEARRDGPAAPDAPTAADGSALEPEVPGPPADRLVEDAGASTADDDTPERP